MSPWLILLLIIVVVLIIWWALLRNAKSYQPDFPMHHDDEHAGHGAEAHETVMDEALVEEPAHAFEEVAANEPQDEAVAAESPLEPETLRAAMPAVEEGAPVEPDDLIIIEGIGPKVNQVLQAAGIYTFVQLAETTPEQLRTILEPAGFRFMDPTSWPQQAQLAAEGKMEELKALQNSLTAGRNA